MINAKMKRGAYLVNTARAKLVDRDAIVKALESGQLAGYAGDVWYPQPAPKDHPWRTMPHEGMTPHTSGSTLSAQARYSAGTREILECFYSGRPIREEYLIAQGGRLAGAGAEGLRGEVSIAELCRKEGIKPEPLLPMVEGISGGRQEAAGWRHGARGDLGRGQGTQG